MLKEKIDKIKKEALEALENIKSEEALENLRINFLGRKSEFTTILKGLKDLSEDVKKITGKHANEVREEIEKAFTKTQKRIAESKFDLSAEKIDVTIPAHRIEKGHLHPITIIQNEIEDIFTSMGFEIADGPEIEIEKYNFDALNMPKDHPARDMQDTFWLRQDNQEKGERILLRTQTSPVQIRFMESHTPPLRIIAPGKIFRNEATDATHEHTFHQFEALVVGDDVNVANFKYIAKEFFSRFFKKDITVRIRPSFFPFTEPSFEFDISCTVCSGKGCKSCKQTGWLEIGGAGMVNQEVFVSSGYPRNKYQGFAWGFGLERLAMMKYKIDDIRHFHSGDLRFISQF
jgi:phenylalanyl-tRNA synthetase alpha chain